MIEAGQFISITKWPTEHADLFTYENLVLAGDPCNSVIVFFALTENGLKQGEVGFLNGGKDTHIALFAINPYVDCVTIFNDVVIGHYHPPIETTKPDPEPLIRISSVGWLICQLAASCCALLN